MILLLISVVIYSVSGDPSWLRHCHYRECILFVVLIEVAANWLDQIKVPVAHLSYDQFVKLKPSTNTNSLQGLKKINQLRSKSCEDLFKLSDRSSSAARVRQPIHEGFASLEELLWCIPSTVGFMIGNLEWHSIPMTLVVRDQISKWIHQKDKEDLLSWTKHILGHSFEGNLRQWTHEKDHLSVIWSFHLLSSQAKAELLPSLLADQHSIFHHFYSYAFHFFGLNFIISDRISTAPDFDCDFDHFDHRCMTFDNAIQFASSARFRGIIGSAVSILREPSAVSTAKSKNLLVCSYGSQK